MKKSFKLEQAVLYSCHTDTVAGRAKMPYHLTTQLDHSFTFWFESLKRNDFRQDIAIKITDRMIRRTLKKHNLLPDKQRRWKEPEPYQWLFLFHGCTQHPSLAQSASSIQSRGGRQVACRPVILRFTYLPYSAITNKVKWLLREWKNRFDMQTW